MKKIVKDRDWGICAYMLVEKNGDKVIMRLFDSKTEAIIFAEKTFAPDSDETWRRIKKREDLEVIKVRIEEDIF